MNNAIAKIAAFSAAAISVGSVMGVTGEAIAGCATSDLLPSLNRTIQFFASTAASTGGGGTTPRGGGGHFLMHDEAGGYVGIDTDGFYGLKNDQTGLNTKVVYYPGGGLFSLRGCRIGVQSASFTCGATVSQTVAHNSTTPTSLLVNLDAIAASTNGSEDNYVIHGFSTGGEAFGASGLTNYPGEKGLRAFSTALGKSAAFEDFLGAAIDVCCW
jgi:hypothetical protein